MEIIMSIQYKLKYQLGRDQQISCNGQLFSTDAEGNFECDEIIAKKILLSKNFSLISKPEIKAEIKIENKKEIKPEIKEEIAEEIKVESKKNKVEPIIIEKKVEPEIENNNSTSEIKNNRKKR